MSQHLLCPDKLSNWFDTVLQGLAPRHCAFMDIDALHRITAIHHDGPTRRFLFQEFKRERDVLSSAQRQVLTELARQPNMAAWAVWRLEGGGVRWLDCGVDPDRLVTLTIEEYRQRFAAWWTGRASAAYGDPALSWMERAAIDASLRAFVDAEIARDRIARAPSRGGG